jgi:hypothetical protein
MVLESHICIGCGIELCRIPAPPDPVYGLPICTCPNCGTSVVRRKHRMRRVPNSFWRLNKLVWLLPTHLFFLLVTFVTFYSFAFFVQTNASDLGLNPIAYLTPSLDKADLYSTVNSVVLVLLILMIPFSGGAWFGHNLTHWQKPWFLTALVIISIVLSGLPMIEVLWAKQPSVEFVELLRTWPLRFEMTSLCSVVAFLGILSAHPSERNLHKRQDMRFRKKLAHARKRLENRRTMQ